MKSHTISPPSAEWRKESNGYWFYYVNNKRVGLWIGKLTSIPIRQHRQVVKYITLPHHIFCIFHLINDAQYDIGTVEVLEAPSLKQAQYLAEWYYKEWLKVNKE